MARFFGVFGYRETREVRNGVWMPCILRMKYFGDVIRRSSRLQSNPDSENQNAVCSNEISIIADAYAYEHFSELVYVEWMNQKWSVTRTEVKHPRLIVTIGDLYNDPSEEEDEIEFDELPNPMPPETPEKPENCDHEVATNREIGSLLDNIFG